MPETTHLRFAQDRPATKILEACRMSSSFEWDEAKERANRQKHRVTFDEAATVFANPLAVIFPDPDHSHDEVREIIIGHSDRNRVLVISFTERGTAVRIISARVATPRERKDYEENPLGGFGR
jgi:uncharacterized DUF497 family protein